MYWFPVCLGVSFLSMKSYYLSKKKNIICIGWVQVTFSNGTSLNIFLLDVYFDKSFIKYIVSLYFQCLRNINMFRDQ